MPSYRAGIGHDFRLRPAVLADLPVMLEIEIQAASLFPPSMLPENISQAVLLRTSDPPSLQAWLG